MHFCERHPGRSGWFAGPFLRASPASVADFVRQRERWVWGLLELAFKSAIPLRRRLLLLHNMVVWALGPLQHPAVVLAVAADRRRPRHGPATASSCRSGRSTSPTSVWIYWEGLKINAASSRPSAPVVVGAACGWSP